MNNKAFSIIEVLIVLALFAILGAVAAEALISSLSASRRVENNINVRESIEAVVARMERELRSAESISCSDWGVDKRINFTLPDDTTSYYYRCYTGGSNKYLSRMSDQLTPDTILVTSCSFSCTAATASATDAVDVSITAEQKGASNTEKAPVTVVTRFQTRSY